MRFFEYQLRFGTTEIYKPGESVPVILDGNEIGRIAVDAILP